MLIDRKGLVLDFINTVRYPSAHFGVRGLVTAFAADSITSIRQKAVTSPRTPKYVTLIAK